MLETEALNLRSGGTFPITWNSNCHYNCYCFQNPESTIKLYQWSWSHITLYIDCRSQHTTVSIDDFTPPDHEKQRVGSVEQTERCPLDL